MQLRGLAIGVAGALLGWLFLARFAPARLLLGETGGPLLAALAVVLACFAVGAGALSLVRRLLGGSTLERVPFLDAFVVGFPTFGTLVAIIAWVSVASLPIVTYACAAAGVALLWLRRDAFRWPQAVSPAALLVAPPVLFAFVAAIVPVNAPDELAYKLAVPHAYQLYGRMVELPLTSHSYLVLALQLTDLAALTISSGIAAKLGHFALYLAALAVLHRLASRIVPAGAWWVVAVFAWTPALMLIAGWCFSEWGVLALLALSVERYHAWLERRDGLDFAVAFAAAGGAMAAKYTAIPWLLAFGLVLAWRHRSEVRLLLTGALITAAFGAFFYVRNAIWTGSPIAPLLLPHAPGVSSYRTGMRFGGWHDLMLGLDVFDPMVADESLGILIAVSFLAGFFALRSRNPVARDLALIGAIQMPILFTIGPGSRNIINGVAALAIAGAALTAEAWLALRAVGRVLLGTIAAVAIAAQGILVVYGFESYEVERYLAGKEQAGAYILRQRPFARPYAWIHQSTPRDARVLLLAENETYYLDRPFLAAANLDSPRIAAWLAQFPTPDALGAELRRQKIGYVVLRKTWYRVARPGLPPLTPIENEFVLQVSPETDRVVTTFLKTQAVLRYRDAEYLIFQLR